MNSRLCCVTLCCAVALCFTFAPASIARTGTALPKKGSTPDPRFVDESGNTAPPVIGIEENQPSARSKREKGRSSKGSSTYRIGVDSIHGFGPESSFAEGSNYDGFRAVFTERGFELVPTATFAPEDLSSLDALIVQQPYTRNVSNVFSATEIQAIRDFVDAGGGLLIVADGGTGADPNAIEDLTSHYGVSFSLNSRSAQGRFVSNFVRHPLTRGVRTVGVDYQRPIQSVAPPSLDLTIGGGDDNVLAVYENHGMGGRVVFLSDGSCWQDPDVATDTPITFGDNRRLLENTLDFLVGVCPPDVGYYLLDSFGARHPVGNPPVITGPVYFGADFARDLEIAGLVSTDPPAYDMVVLDGFGAAHYLENSSLQPTQDFYFGGFSLDDFPKGRAVDLELTEDSLGFWVLTDFGGIYRAGSSKDAMEDALVPNSGYMGSLGFDVPYGALRDSALPNPGGASLRAVSFVVIDTDRDNKAEGYVVLDSQGGRFHLQPDGNEIPAGTYSGSPDSDPLRLLDPTGYVWPFFPGLDIARDMELFETQQGVVILDGWDGIHPIPVNLDTNPVFFATNHVSASDSSPRSPVGMPYIQVGFDDPTTGELESDTTTYGFDATSIFTDLEFTTCGGGLYTLDKFGGVFALGSARVNDADLATPFSGSPYFFPFLYAEDIEVFGDLTPF